MTETLMKVLADIDQLIKERDHLQTRVFVLENQVSHGNKPKLTKREVSEIRSLKRDGWTNQEIADAYEINRSTVSRIVRGQYHKGV